MATGKLERARPVQWGSSHPVSADCCHEGMGLSVAATCNFSRKDRHLYFHVETPNFLTSGFGPREHALEGSATTRAPSVGFGGGAGGVNINPDSATNWLCNFGLIG